MLLSGSPEKHVGGFLILPFHGFGHFNALFGVAKALQQNHRVLFAGVAYFENHVSSHGFSYRSLSSYPFGIGLEGWIHDIRKSRNRWWKNVTDRWSDKLFNERKAELSELIAEYKPAHILIDTQQATDGIVVKSIDPSIKVSLVSMTAPYLLLPGFPPINSLAFPGDIEQCNRDYLEAVTSIRSRNRRQWFKYFGMGDRAIIDRSLRRNKLQHLKDEHLSLIMLAVKDVDQYILTYKEFDFHHPYFDRFHYVGPHSVDERVFDHDKTKKKTLVYCSFGTVPTRRDINGFLEKLKEVKEELNFELVVGSKSNWVDQNEVLSRASVFITHGGINSVHDAIRHKVPMIVFPVDPTYDQNGNATRVVYHRLGLRGDLDTVTTKDLRRMIVEVRSLGENFKLFDSTRYTIDNFIQKLVS